MVVIVKEHLREVLHAAGPGDTLWPYAATRITDVMRHSTGRLWVQPAVGEVVPVTSPGPKQALGKQRPSGG
eukprot:12509213-Prorocentrum_lima.AAC.1